MQMTKLLESFRVLPLGNKCRVDVARGAMQMIFYIAGFAAIVIGAVVAADASGFIGDPTLRTVQTSWMFGGLVVSLAGAAMIFAARGAK
jgi:hypothetical protein